MQAKIRHFKWLNLALALLIVCGSIIGVPVAPAYADSCKDVKFVFARGSGEGINDKSYREWESTITQQLVNTTLTYDFYELGSNQDALYQYPATAVSGGFWDYVNLVSAYFSGGKAFAFGASVEEGMAELESYVTNISRACPQTKFVLGGYSQGAMVVTQTLPSLDPNRIVFVTNFGDPKLYLPEGNNMNGLFPVVPEACHGKNLSEYRTHVPDCYAYEGVLGSQRPYREKSFLGKVGTWCNKSDIMCSSGMNIDDHSAYISENLYADAASKIYQKLSQAFSTKFPSKKSLNLHDVLFLLDATGSMQDLMKLYRNELKSLAKQVYDSGGRAGLWGYRDSLTEQSSWAMCELGCSERDFFNRIGYYSASGGGDAKESLLSALHYAMKESAWRWGATKSIVVLTDDGYKEPDFEDVDLPQIIAESLAIDPVNVYVIAPRDLAGDYAKLTTQTNGKFFGLNPKLDETVLTENLAVLKTSSEQIFGRPVAKLNLANYVGNIDQEFTFDASGSYGFSGRTLQYDWDLDGDGTFELLNRSAKVDKTYSEPFGGFIQVRVHDGELSSTMSARVQVLPKAVTFEVPATIASLSYSLQDDDSAQINFSAEAADYALVSLNEAPLGFVEASQTQNSFLIREVTQDLTVTLTPYSTSGQRGIGRSLQIALPKPINPPEESEPSPDTHPLPNTRPSSGARPSNSHTTTARQTKPNLPKPNPPASTFPTAPDTGTYDRCLALATGT